MSLVLRHEPQRIGIVLDDAGWVAVDVLLDALALAGAPIERSELEHIVASSDKKRFALSKDGTLIRANQGHSVEVDLGLSPATPPSPLFHGTIARFVSSIRERGLLRGERHHVHLSHDVETARRVAERRAAAIILSIDSARMVVDGHTFFRSDNGVWLIEHVPADYITVPGSPKSS